MRKAPEGRTFYEENGYLIVEDVLSENELHALRRACDEIEERAQSLETRTPSLKPRILPSGRRVVDVVKGAVLQHSEFFKACTHEKVLDAVEMLIGPNIQHHHSKLNWKPPLPPESAAYGWNIDWHQDYCFFPHTNYDLLATAVYLDDSNDENGCMVVVPGSHKRGPLNHMRDGQFSGACQEPRHFGDASRWRTVCVRAGGISIHHGLLLHSSRPNLSARARRALFTQYRSADNAQVAGRTSHIGWGFTVRGTHPGTIRFENGVVCPLPDGVPSD